MKKAVIELEKQKTPRLVCIGPGAFVMRASQNFVHSLSYTVHRTNLMVVLPQASWRMLAMTMRWICFYSCQISSSFGTTTSDS